MTTNPSLPPVIHQDKKILFEIGNSEKQLWALIHSKGLLHSDAQDLYRKVRCSYEKIILNTHMHSELQDAEYSLWKLHYKHIDEFRKRIKRSSGNAENQKSVIKQDGVVQRNNENHLEPFKSFLSEATEFYQNLIVKLRKHYGVPEEVLFYKQGWISNSVEPDVMLKCQYFCHRCLVCMGDLARYKQQCENPDGQNHNWSAAATHYLEAARIWPDSGNPQNQLAVLATYIGDELLALYHCIRSLAVKEPFPDAWDNLILLFEKNRSSHLQYASSEVCFDFLKPSGSSGEETKVRPKDDSSNCKKFEAESNQFPETKLWSLVVRTISFLLITSSLEEFPLALASAVGELDKMMELEDIKLKTVLESYKQMDLARRGPFRSLQLVSILIFSLKNLINKLEKNDKNDEQQLVLLQLAVTAAFSFMGRFLERCLKSTSSIYCPLLPSVLVFVEWCASMSDEIEVSATDEKSRRAIYYFFGMFVELLNQLNENRKETKKILDNTPLWEDYELKGFVPIASSHFSLDFSGNWEHIDNFESGIELRTERIRKAAMKIAERSNKLQKGIVFDESGKNFYVARSDEDHEKKEKEKVESSGNITRGKEPNQKINEDTGEHEKRVTESNRSTSGKTSVVEEEEVILFRPLTRYNSAPAYPSTTTEERILPKDKKDDQTLPSDECLRRATSLLMAQNPSSQSDPWEFPVDIVNFRSDNKSFTQQEHSMKESNAHTFSESPISSGPPSLSAWVLDGGSFSSNKKDHGTNAISEHRLQPIEEIASSSLAGLSINETENLVISRVNESSYSVPVPSAPLLPENAAWFTDGQPSLSAPLMPDNPSRISGYSDWNATNYGPTGHESYDPRFPPFSKGYPPPGRMTSSEWLRWYRENCKQERADNNYVHPPTHLNALGNHGNFLYQDIYRFDQFGRWVNSPLSSNDQYIYMEPPAPPQPLQPGFLFNDFQRPSSYYGCGAVTDLRTEPQPLLQYLKEKEWPLQRDPTPRGPTFMGS